MTVHKPVLLKEVIEGLALKPGSTVVDATLGGGGYALKILSAIQPDGKLIAFDQDPEAVARFEKLIAGSKPEPKEREIGIIRANFAGLEDNLVASKVAGVEAIVADLGLSSDQLENSGRGFSFQREEPLDMRMNPDEMLTAEAVVNGYAPEVLEEMLKRDGEERYARQIVRAIVKARVSRPIRTTLELAEIVVGAVPPAYRHGRIHPATKTFQAVRMAVNREREVLNSFLDQAMRCLKPGGRLAVVTFHSGEDRAVKEFFRVNARGCICPPEFPICRCDHRPSVKIITTKPIVAGEEEVRLNPRARSAKLRIAEKV